MKKSGFEWKGGVVAAWDIDELNLSKSIESQIDLLKEDLVQVRFGGAITLDLGWYPEFDSEGQFILYVVKSGNWESPIWQLKFRELSEFKRNLAQAIEIVNDQAFDV